jgi:hypothetical protein
LLRLPSMNTDFIPFALLFLAALVPAFLMFRGSYSKRRSEELDSPGITQEGRPIGSAGDLDLQERTDTSRLHGQEGADRPLTLDHSGPPKRDRQWRGVDKKTG